MKSRSLSLQAGLTLLEMIIGLSVIVLVLVLSITSFDQNSGRAQSLEAKMQLVRAGVLRFQTDLPCGPATLSALTMREKAAVGLCGDSNNLNNWRGPYIDSGSTYVNGGDSDISNILPGASLAITQQVVDSTTGSAIYTILKVSEISDEMRSAMVALCSDDCTPYKHITGDTETIGILISRLSFQVSNPGGDLVAFGATPAVSTGPVVFPIAILPPTFVPPVITLPSTTISPYVGPIALLVTPQTLTPRSPMPTTTQTQTQIPTTTTTQIPTTTQTTTQTPTTRPTPDVFKPLFWSSAPKVTDIGDQLGQKEFKMTGVVINDNAYPVAFDVNHITDGAWGNLNTYTVAANSYQVVTAGYRTQDNLIVCSYPYTCPKFAPALDAVFKNMCEKKWTCILTGYSQFPGSHTMSISRAIYDSTTVTTTAAEGIIGDTEKFYVIAPPGGLILSNNPR